LVRWALVLLAVLPQALRVLRVLRALVLVLTT
jgi:hypothetical protein